MQQQQHLRWGGSFVPAYEIMDGFLRVWIPEGKDGSEEEEIT